MKQKKDFDVAILGWWYGKNYGSTLTYYALNRTVTKLGYKALMVHEPIGYNAARVMWPDDIWPLQFAKRVNYSITPQFHYSELPKLNELADIFIVGSDQLWNPLIPRVNDDLFLDFVENGKKRIAYATSFGNNNTKKFSQEFIEKHRQNLESFDAISVREEYAINIAKDIFGVHSTQVVDPVFLLDSSEYVDLASTTPATNSSEPYLAIFFLDPTLEKKHLSLAIANKLGLKKIVVIPNPDDGRELIKELFSEEIFEILKEDSPEYFLRAYYFSHYVITDSFHGTAFSIIFEKPFSSFYNTKRGADRFKSLMATMGFNNERRIYEDQSEDEIFSNKNISMLVDFSFAKKTLEDLRLKSLTWLTSALSSPLKTNPPSVKKLDKNNNEKSAEIINPNTLQFDANNNAWKIEKRATNILLSLRPEKSARGNLVWLNLPHTLPSGKYRLTLKWTVRTTSNHINIHLRDSKTGKFLVIGKINNTNKNSETRVDTLDFFCSRSTYNQIMIGAIHFTGSNAGAEITSISLKRIAENITPPLETTTKKNDIAIPANTPSRSQIIHRILTSSKIAAWKSELKSLLPSTTIYAAREMKEYTNNKVGGPADILIFPRNQIEICEAIKYSSQNGIPLTILGKCSNVIIRDGGIRGIVILTTKLDYLEIKQNTLIAGAGAGLIEASHLLLNNSKSGLEWAAGIPGTIGGAVFMNAGTNVSDIRQTIKSVRVIDRTGRIFDLNKSDIEWGKRFTTFQERRDWTILEASFNLEDGDPTEIHKSMIRTVQVRENHFPLENPNHGSTFKWWRAPRLIMQAGLVGKSIGGAQISEKQPGFFINKNQATAADYEALINYTIAKVYEFSGFLLEPEVEIIGERPHRYERYSSNEPPKNLDIR